MPKPVEMTVDQEMNWNRRNMQISNCATQCLSLRLDVMAATERSFARMVNSVSTKPPKPDDAEDSYGELMIRVGTHLFAACPRELISGVRATTNSLRAEETSAAGGGRLNREIGEVQTIFGGGNGGRSELGFSLSDSNSKVSTVTTSGDGIRGDSGTIESGRQKLDDPCP